MTPTTSRTQSADNHIAQYLILILPMLCRQIFPSLLSTTTTGKDALKTVPYPLLTQVASPVLPSFCHCLQSFDRRNSLPGGATILGIPWNHVQENLIDTRRYLP